MTPPDPDQTTPTTRPDLVAPTPTTRPDPDPTTPTTRPDPDPTTPTTRPDLVAPTPPALPDLVAGHARRDPAAPAVRQGDNVVTYGALASAAAELAAGLRSRGAGPEVLVGVCVDRTPGLVTAIVGVLAAGAVYVPLDPALPAARLRAIVAAAGLSTVVADPVGQAALTGIPDDSIGAAVEFVAVPAPSSDPGSPAGPAPVVHPAQAAYAMFTSGSTGVPKGVLVPHGALSEVAANLTGLAGLGPDTVSLALASIGFDASVLDLLAPLAAGGCVAVIGAADRADPVRLQQFAADHAVTVAFVPPALLPVLDPAGLPDLRVVLTGAEAPGPAQVARWSGPTRRFFNLYGPTEATVYVTAYEASGVWDTPLPIGTAVAHHDVYLVDGQLHRAERGELLVGGAGLARGYLGDPGLTAARFVPDPYGPPGGRLYRTGDLAAWRDDGTLSYQGRADRQVKVRGQRVEIGEIEAVLHGHPGVGHAVVAAVAHPDGLALHAFVTPVDSGPSADPTGPAADTPTDPTALAAELRDHCARTLPAAMVPRTVDVLAELPLRSTGKVDLDALVARLDTSDRVATGAGGPPRTATEHAVAAAWTAVLGPVAVGVDDDFFDGGGHSISAMRMVGELRQRTGQAVSIEDILGGRTLAEIAARVDRAAALRNVSTPRGRPPALSASQRRLWFLERYSPEAATAYNVVLAERLDGDLDLGALRRALDAVARRHEVLRWRIVDDDGVARPVVDPPGPVTLVEHDLRGRADAGTAAADLLRAAGQHRFRLAAEPLWRPVLVRLAERQHILAVVAHHAVFDGWSQGILYADLAIAYDRARRGDPADLDPLPATYGDYVAYRKHRLADRGEADLDWWLTHLEGAPTLLELPTDQPRPPEQTYPAARAGQWLDPAATTRVRHLARAEGATLSAVLLAAVGLVAGDWSGQPDLVIGTPTVDRREPDFETMIGFFIDIAPLRLRREAGAGFADHVRQARDELLAALAHPEAAVDRIVAGFGLGGQVARTPLVQVLFNMFNFPAPSLDLPGLASRSEAVDPPGSPFDVTVYGQERDGRLGVEVVYNPDLFAPARMESFVDAVVGWLRSGPADPARPVGAVGPGPRVPTARRRPRAATGVAVPPATATERQVAAVWCEVLGLPAVGVTDSFFDVGGTSVAVATVQHRLRVLTGRALRVVDLFRFPTVRTVAAFLDGDGEADDQISRAAQRGAARRGRGRRPTQPSTVDTEEGAR